MEERRNWAAVIDRLNRSKSGRVSIPMGSPGSAQVTRVRLLAEYDGLCAETRGSVLLLWNEGAP